MELKEKLSKIEDWEMCLIGELNEEYDDWYNSSAPEFLFEDPEHILRGYEKIKDKLKKLGANIKVE